MNQSKWTEERINLVLENLDLPHKLYHGRFAREPVNKLLDEEEAIALGYYMITIASGQWLQHRNKSEFRPYAATAIFHHWRFHVKTISQRLTRRSRIDPYVRNYRLSSNLDVEQCNVVTEILSKMTGDDRALLEDKEVRGLPFRELALKRGCSKTAVIRDYDIAIQRARRIARRNGYDEELGFTS